MSLKSLFVCTASPFGEAGGSGRRSFNTATALAGLGAVSMLVAAERPWTEEQIAKANELFDVRRVIYYRRRKRSIRGLIERELNPRYLNLNGTTVEDDETKFVTELIRNFDVVWVHTTKVANSLGVYKWNRAVLDIDDIPSEYHRRAGAEATTIKEKLKRMHRARLAKRLEGLIFERFNVLAVCKDEDRGLFRYPNRVKVVPNTVELSTCELFQGQRRPLHYLGMLGDFNHPPNVVGLEWFVERVLPEIAKMLPSVQLRVVGRKSCEIALKFDNHRVKGLGYVQSLRGEVDAWSAMIVPTRIGGGTHVKVAEGFARGVPIVSTSHGTRGYSVNNGEHVLVSDSESQFGANCVRLLTDPNFGQKLAVNSFNLYNRFLSPTAIKNSVQEAVSAAISSDISK